MFDFLDISTLIYRAPALLIALSLHEYAHAYVSTSLGDPTPKAQGRLTANPLAHIDVMGLIMLVVCGFGWAKPVGIDPRYYKNYKTGVMKVSFAGPAMNLFLCFLAEFIGIMMMQFGYLTVGQGGYYFLYWIMLYNVWFALFNLIPIPTLDGSQIMEMLLPSQMAYQFHQMNERYSFLILIILVFSGVLGKIINPLADFYIKTVFDVISFFL